MLLKVSAERASGKSQRSKTQRAKITSKVDTITDVRLVKAEVRSVFKMHGWTVTRTATREGELSSRTVQWHVRQ